MTLAAGTRLGPYEIVSAIGSGGMGEVYRARDTRLGRAVAIKVLPAEVSEDPERLRRFEQEARAASALNHPNVVAVYDVGREGAVSYIAMELVEGQSLRELVATDLPPLRKALQIAAQIADGLAKAHSAGIIHRDLKPENVMVSKDGFVKILDFGLAKLTRPESGKALLSEMPTATRVTEPGIALGTVGYMSPEQVRGQPVDHHSDIFAFGAILYELLTGRRAFRGGSPVDTLSAILKEEPPELSRVGVEFPPALERVVRHCLEKNREERFESARDVAFALREAGSLSIPSPAPGAPARRRIPRVPAWTLTLAGAVALLAALFVGDLGGLRRRLSGGAATRIESLAVLPLENFSRDPEQEYFADGMTDELTTNLAQISALRVISRTSVMQYKGTKRPLPEVARELHVDAVVEGSVVRAGDRVRITAQLVHAPTDRHLWARSYERDLRDVLTLQSEVAHAIANEIKVKLTPQEQMRLARARPINPAAHEAYLKGTYYFSQGSLDQGKESFQQAINLDPDYAPAYAALASYYIYSGFFGVLPPNEAFLRSKEAAEKALEKDDALALAHDALAFVKVQYEWNWADAQREFQGAIELNPSNADIHHDYAHYLMSMDRDSEALAESQRAVELDPFDAVLIACLGWHSLYARQYDQAIDHSLKAIRMEPDYFWAHLVLGWAYEQKSLFEEAIAEFRRAVALSEGFPVAKASLGHAFAVAGKRREALEVTEQLAEQSKRSYVSAYDMAAISAGLGDKDRTFEWLQKAYTERSSLLVHVKWDPRFDPLHSDPHFGDLLRRIGLPP